MRPLPQKIVEGLTTKSDKIRALHAADYSRTEIAQFLDIRYQHVRNVLVTRTSPGSKKSSGKGAAVMPQVQEPESWPTDRLIEAGFTSLAECQSIGANAFSYTTSAPKEAGVYAFAVDGVIVYVGLTRSGLRARLGHYVHGHAQQRTSLRIKGLILEALAGGKSVSVLIATPPPFVWNGLPVDGAAGLETGLIALIKPRWNQQGVKLDHRLPAHEAD